MIDAPRSSDFLDNLRKLRGEAYCVHLAMIMRLYATVNAYREMAKVSPIAAIGMPMVDQMWDQELAGMCRILGIDQDDVVTAARLGNADATDIVDRDFNGR